MNFTNTDSVNKKNSMNLPIVGGGVFPRFRNPQVKVQFYWQMFYQFNPIQYKIKLEIKI